jgi:hypothetical protein
MNLNKIVKANIPVLLGVRELWGEGYVFVLCLNLAKVM